MSAKPTITLKLRDKQLVLSLDKTPWLLWRILTYPLALGAGWYFFGAEGSLFVGIMLVLTNRGKL